MPVLGSSRLMTLVFLLCLPCLSIQLQFNILKGREKPMCSQDPGVPD